MTNPIPCICIIDDDPIHIFTAKRILQIEKICDTILVFKDGKEGYDSLKEMINQKKTLPKLILLDLNMPIWDGWDFLEEFTKLEESKDVKILINSSSQNQEDLNRARNYGRVSGFVVKPFTIDDFREQFEFGFGAK
jgi:CheY-like chemotaxis protein